MIATNDVECASGVGASEVVVGDGSIRMSFGARATSVAVAIDHEGLVLAGGPVPSRLALQELSQRILQSESRMARTLGFSQ